MRSGVPDIENTGNLALISMQLMVTMIWAAAGPVNVHAGEGLARIA